MSRFRYFALLVCALFAIVVLLSMLSIAAIFALPLAVLGLVGVVSPSVISTRPLIRRISDIGLVVVGGLFVVVTGRLAVTRRRPVELVVDGTAPRKIRVIYGVADGAPQPWSWTRQIVIPPSNIAFVQYADNGSWYSADDPHPIRVIMKSVRGTEHNGFGSWVAGGYTEGGACHFEYDEYSVGNPSTVAVAARAVPPDTGWLDSLDTWGVECRGGKLVRSHSGNVPNLRRTSVACYYLTDGAVSCSSLPVASKSNALAP